MSESAKESNKTRFDSYSRQEQCIDNIRYYLSDLGCRVHIFSDNLSRNSCILSFALDNGDTSSPKRHVLIALLVPLNVENKTFDLN